MLNRDYLPKGDATLSAWLSQFKTAIAATGDSVGISGSELSAITADCETLINDIAAVSAAKQALKGAVSGKKATHRRVTVKLRKLSNRIKTHPDYTGALGKTYGIVGTAERWDAERAKPVLRLKISGGKVIVNYRKSGSHGVRIWCKRGAEADYTFLAQDNIPPYYDNRPNLSAGAEQRSYYAFYIDKEDAVTGRQSDIAVVNV